MSQANGVIDVSRLVRRIIQRLIRIDGVLVVVTNAYHSSADFARQMETYVTETLGDDRGLAALGKVKILSGLSDADLEALYRRADLVALPTRDWSQRFREPVVRFGRSRGVLSGRLRVEASFSSGV